MNTRFTACSVFGYKIPKIDFIFKFYAFFISFTPTQYHTLRAQFEYALKTFYSFEIPFKFTNSFKGSRDQGLNARRQRFVLMPEISLSFLVDVNLLVSFLVWPSSLKVLNLTFGCFFLLPSKFFWFFPLSNSYTKLPSNKSIYSSPHSYLLNQSNLSRM